MRTFLVFCLISLTLFPSKGEGLSDLDTSTLSGILTDEYKPYPVYGDSAWTSLPDSVKAPYLEAAAKAAGETWESLPASLFMKFRATGERESFQDVYFRKRTRLADLAKAELLEGKGRFLLPLADGVLSTCEETWWGLPAHYGPNLPVPERQEVDLFAAQTAGDLAMIQYIFRNAFDKISPELNKRIKAELRRRVLLPCREKNFGWMRQAHNWNPWITSHWVNVILLAEPDKAQRSADLAKAAKALQYYFSHYSDDGGCDEGPLYWGSSPGNFFNAILALDKATDGSLNLAGDDKFRRMGEFICKAYIGSGNCFINFADAHPTTELNAGMVYEYGRYIDSPLMKGFGAKKAKDLIASGKQMSQGEGHSFNGFLYTMLSAPEILASDGVIPLDRDVWMPRIEVFITRRSADTDRGYTLAAKGGHNDENHNHNDVGNFILYSEGSPLIVDLGRMEYTKDYFSKDRYKTWGVNSDYHNLPVINGVTQRNGKNFAAREVKAVPGNASSRFTVDIAGAYPEEAGVNSWKRALKLSHKKNELTVAEKYDLKKRDSDTYVVLLTSATPEKLTDGSIRLSQDGRTHLLKSPSKDVTITFEPLDKRDIEVSRNWKQIYRIFITPSQKAKTGEILYTITEE